MKQTALPQNVKGLNAVVLIIMAIVTLDSIEPWTAWNVDPTSPGYGWNRFSYFTIQSNFIAMVTYLIAAVAIFRNKQLGEWFRYLRAGAVLYDGNRDCTGLAVLMGQNYCWQCVFMELHHTITFGFIDENNWTSLRVLNQKYIFDFSKKEIHRRFLFSC